MNKAARFQRQKQRAQKTPPTDQQRSLRIRLCTPVTEKEAEGGGGGGEHYAEHCLCSTGVSSPTDFTLLQQLKMPRFLLQSSGFSPTRVVSSLTTGTSLSGTWPPPKVPFRQHRKQKTYDAILHTIRK